MKARRYVSSVLEDYEQRCLILIWLKLMISLELLYCIVFKYLYSAPQQLFAAVSSFRPSHYCPLHKLMVACMVWSHRLSRGPVKNISLISGRRWLAHIINYYQGVIIFSWSGNETLQLNGYWIWIYQHSACNCSLCLIYLCLLHVCAFFLQDISLPVSVYSA